eukprot:9477868-Pyramimonas_sp.AAC.2
MEAPGFLAPSAPSWGSGGAPGDCGRGAGAPQGCRRRLQSRRRLSAVSYTHLRAHETGAYP